jgi:predicted nucleotidyltransferase
MPFPDYEEFIASLNENRVKYLIVGAQALAYHARPRATKDLDIFIEPSAMNAGRVLQSLKTFFGVETGYTISDLVQPGTIIQLGVAPVRIDLLTTIAGLSNFADAWKNRVDAAFGANRAHFIGLDDLIKAKQASNRLQDRADVRVLKKVRKKHPPATIRKSQR